MERETIKKDSLITREEIKSILSLRGKNRIEKIISSPNPAALVAKIPEVEIFLTVKEVGEHDAIELIELTTPEQLTYLLDLDLWDKDQITPKRFLSWLEILEQCGEKKLRQFFQTADLEFLVSAFRKLIRVIPAPNPDELPEEKKDAPLFSLDQIYLVEFLEENSAPLLMRLLHFLYTSMPNFYRLLMEELLWSIPAEDEELALRWRNGRLADHGFPSFDEALEIYSYISPQKIKETSYFLLPAPEENFHPPTYLEVASKDTFFSLALQHEVSEEIQERVKWELTGLINRVLIADGAHLGDVEALHQSAQKALQTLDLGLKYLSQENPREARFILEKIPVTKIFQTGFSLGLDLKKKAQSIVKNGWLANLPRREDILDSPLKETIKGLLRKRPLFFNEEKGNYVPFTQLSDLSLTEERLEKISFLGEFTHHLLGLRVEEIIKVEKTNCFFPDPPLSTICLTYLIQGFLHGEKKLAPLTVFELQKVYEKLRLDGYLDEQTRAFQLLKEMVSQAITAAGEKLKGRRAEILSWWLEFLSNKLYSCLGHLQPGEAIDPRAVDVFLVSYPD